MAGRRSKTPSGDGGKHGLRAAKGFDEIHDGRGVGGVMSSGGVLGIHLCFNTYMAEGREYFPIVQDRVRTRQFNSLFLFVTSRCNSLCRTCFYFDKLNSKDDLTDERDRAHLRDRAAISQALALGRRAVPARRTGGYRRRFRAPQRRPQRQSADQRTAPGEDLSRAWIGCWSSVRRRRIDLNFSLDGMQKTHDNIRGVPNNFVRTLATMRRGGKAVSRA